MEPLWSDEKINSLTVQNANNLDSDARWMHEQIVTDMRNDYERELSVRNETIGNLQNELRNMQARIAELEEKAEKRETELVRQVDIVIDLQQYIAELEAQMSLKWPGVWQPTIDDVTDLSRGDGRRVMIGDDGASLIAELVTRMGGYASVTVTLPDDVRLCRKVQPAE